MRKIKIFKMKRVLSLVGLFLGVSLSIISAQVVLKSSNLPIVVIKTLSDSIKNEPKVTATMGIIDHGKGKRNSITDAFNNYNGTIGIEFRGQSSQDNSPKKPYSIELRDATGADQPASIMGMPEESDWALIAPYADKSLIRDALTYTIAAHLMPYAPRFRFCELILNDKYQGVYMMTEKIKRDKNRVDIAKLKTLDVAGDSLTGGYVFKWDKGSPGDLSFPSKYKTGDRPHRFFVEYPKQKDIQPQQLAYLKTYVQNFEAVLAGNNYKDTQSGYQKYIDVKSFIDYNIINEWSYNIDAQRLSTYFYKDKDSKDPRLKAGPVWDYNLAFGNANYCEHDKVEGWLNDFNLRCPQDYWLQPFWFKRFWSDHKYAAALGQRWQKLRKDTLSDARINAQIDSLAAELEEAQERNFQRWNILKTWVWPNAYVGNTYYAEIQYLKIWLKDRALWLDKNMAVLQNPAFVPEDYFDLKVYPNPSRGFVNFDFYLAENQKVNIEIFDVLGQSITTLKNTENQLNGITQLRWENPQTSGIYFYRVFKDRIFLTSGKVLLQ